MCTPCATGYTKLRTWVTVSNGVLTVVVSVLYELGPSKLGR